MKYPATTGIVTSNVKMAASRLARPLLPIEFARFHITPNRIGESKAALDKLVLLSALKLLVGRVSMCVERTNV